MKALLISFRYFLDVKITVPEQYPTECIRYVIIDLLILLPSKDCHINLYSCNLQMFQYCYKLFIGQLPRTQITDGGFLFRIENKGCNFPKFLETHFIAESIELARRCVEPPLKVDPK